MECLLSEGGTIMSVSISVMGVRSEVLLHSLEDKEIYISAGSACSSHKRKPSATLSAMGMSKDRIESTVRLSFCEEKHDRRSGLVPGNHENTGSDAQTIFKKIIYSSGENLIKKQEEKYQYDISCIF